ncbi:alpha/beta fold hydrolase [Streptomyces sp. TRM43335]|uniref:Alpha/beta fold hydrolase n=1 Tax=Streptomyces taklimakanensis TaxID=2569853 RepID=A0A6G2B9M6_9ACTN|nr:alpha/beta hydrolase [Streptomyces taklimakanensis]MTE18958.1 alpha/beta fold hydrolase [Streptomyces taklimakanensis]
MYETIRVRVGDRTLCCLDFGGAGVPVLALHGTFGRGSVFARAARDLAGRARIVAPDQRGHGLSDRAADYGRDGFVEDAAHLLRELGLAPAVVLGHSLGGITAYQLAARHPKLVRALVVEDVGPVMREPEIARPVLDVRGWPATGRTREELARRVEEAGAPDSAYFLHSAVQDGDRWRLLFDWDDMTAVQEGGTGDWWADWLGSTCPALVLHGGRSPLLPAWLAREMTERRPRTRLVTFPSAGHWVHDDAPEDFARAVADFLDAPG